MRNVFQIKTPDRPHRRRSVVFIFSFEHISSASIINSEQANICYVSVLIISMRSYTFYSNSIESHNVAKQNILKKVLFGKGFLENDFNLKSYYFCSKSL